MLSLSDANPSRLGAGTNALVIRYIPNTSVSSVRLPLLRTSRGRLFEAMLCHG